MLMLYGGPKGSYDADWLFGCAKNSKRLRLRVLRRSALNAGRSAMSREQDTGVSRLSLRWDAPKGKVNTEYTEYTEDTEDTEDTEEAQSTRSTQRTQRNL